MSILNPDAKGKQYFHCPSRTSSCTADLRALSSSARILRSGTSPDSCSLAADCVFNRRRNLEDTTCVDLPFLEIGQRPLPTHTHTRFDSVVIQSNIKTSGLKLRYVCQVRYVDSLNVELSAWKRKLSLFGWTVLSGSRQHRRACGTTKLLPPQAPLTKCSHPGIHALFVIEERFPRGAGDS